MILKINLMVKTGSYFCHCCIKMAFLRFLYQFHWWSMLYVNAESVINSEYNVRKNLLTCFLEHAFVKEMQNNMQRSCCWQETELCFCFVSCLWNKWKICWSDYCTLHQIVIRQHIYIEKTVSTVSILHSV